MPDDIINKPKKPDYEQKDEWGTWRVKDEATGVIRVLIRPGPKYKKTHPRVLPVYKNREDLEKALGPEESKKRMWNK